MTDSKIPIVRFNELQDMIKAYYPDADLDLIRAAYIYSAQVHRGQTRRSGEPYLVHPVAVALLLTQMKLDEASIATGLLHDTVEDTFATLEDIERFFGKEIAVLVDGVTKISKIEFQSKEERQAENFRKMILAMSQDIRVLLVKLGDRLHNMRTLASMPSANQIRTATETMEIYAPLAARLGIYWIRTELEDLAFRYLEPERYNTIKTKLEESLKKNEAFVNNVLSVISEKLEQYGIKGETKGRTKEIYSIHRKMVNQRLEFDHVHDITAFRITLETVNQCYAVLGLIHSLWRPVPGRFKDYVAMPKSNGYQSLHTTVIGPAGARIEIQIRTQEMDRIAEEGIAAHWSYKEGRIVETEDAKVVKWLRQMMEWQRDLDDPREFLENVRVDLYPDEVYVFTPTGEVKDFPKGSTPLDFAYSIHTEVGHRCMGAKVNGKMVSLKHQLKTGDTIEITTSLHQKPSKDWLKFVKTGRARTKIRHFVMAEERERSIHLGREAVDRELRKWRLDLSRAEKEGEFSKIAQEYSFKSDLDLFAAIGYGRISPKVVVTRLVPVQEREKAKADSLEERPMKPDREGKTSGIKVQGLTGVLATFAKCCNPLPGDNIMGYITRGRGVTVHKEDCMNLQATDSIRLVEVTWDYEQSLTRVVRLSIEASNRTGLLAAISKVFASNDSDIVQASMKKVTENYAKGLFLVSVKNVEHLSKIMNALLTIKEVSKVERLGTV